MDAADLADRKPRQLSGGQAQRVALARALAADPEVLLLDEPLTGLDVGAAAAMRAVLRRVLVRDGRSSVLVTHDLLDVVTLADRVVVLEAGRVAESGPTATVLTAPRSHLRRAVRRHQPGERTAGRELHAGDRGGSRCGTARLDGGLHGGVGAVATFHPSAVAVYRDEPHGSPRNTVEVVIAELDGRGPAIRVGPSVSPTAHRGWPPTSPRESATDLRLGPGQRVFFTVKSQEVSIHPAPVTAARVDREQPRAAPAHRAGAVRRPRAQQSSRMCPRLRFCRQQSPSLALNSQLTLASRP